MNPKKNTSPPLSGVASMTELKEGDFPWRIPAWDRKFLSCPVNEVYLAGPMRGYVEYNYPAFKRAATLLRSRGVVVHNPAENDAKLSIEDLNKYDNPLKMYLRQDLQDVLVSDAVVVLPGWEESLGARTEVTVAFATSTPVYEYTTWNEVKSLPAPANESYIYSTTTSLEPVLDFGPRVMSEDASGGRKEETQARFDLLPPDALTELARVYGYGEAKYPSDVSGPNYLKGYAWHKSIASLLRHTMKFMFGESHDPETGLHHLAHAAWHCFTLIAFEKRGLGTDDRKKKGQ